MTYVGASGAGYILLFGGWSGTAVLGDFWKWTGTNWVSITTAVSHPTSRYQGGLSYDPAGGDVVLFGGCTSAPGPCAPRLPTPMLFDSWSYGPSGGGTWTHLTMTFPPGSPPPRSVFGMTYDASDRYNLLFGGSTPAGPLNDTWMFHSSAWTLV